LEFSGLHYCLFVKVLFFLLEVFPEELSFLSLRQLIEFIISSSVCQELFSFLFSSFFRNLVAYHSQQQFNSLSELTVRVKQFFHLFSKMITTAFAVGLQYSILPFPCQ